MKNSKGQGRQTHALTTLQYDLLLGRVHGRTGPELAEEHELTRVQVSAQLDSARDKLGARTVEHAVALTARADQVRQIAARITRMAERSDPVFRPRLEALARIYRDDADAIVRAPAMPMCMHGVKLLVDACLKCLRTRPGRHKFDPVEAHNTRTGRLLTRCFVCGRPARDHNRAKSARYAALQEETS